ncbi:MAG: hypothetical protein KAS32_16550 [Candidatus Peribacteraceae bacterium]|nr:hypothetical protein [Candidatus Peribacteraceae bacterium]
MSISRLRLENNSIFNYIKYEVISPQFTELSSGDDLVYNQALGAYVTQTDVEPLPTSNGRGWSIFDDYTVNGKIVVDSSQEQTSKVVVVGASSYTVNYKNGSIKDPDTVPTSVSYYWDYVAVVPYWPGTNPPPLPFVSMSIEGSKKEGFQLGGGTKNLRTVYFDIFATSPAERDDISDVIHTALFNHTISIKDFSGGSYLNYDGTFNTGLSFPLTLQGTIRFIDTNHKNIHSVDDWSTLQKHRSIISGTYESFVDSV